MRRDAVKSTNPVFSLLSRAWEWRVQLPACRSGSGSEYVRVLGSVVLFHEAAFSAMEISEGCFNMPFCMDWVRARGAYGQ